MLPCTLRQLEVFLAAAEDCHFTKTANRLGISQAAVSRQVRALERQFGHRLFVRQPGGRPVLSREGTALLREGQALQADTRRIRAMQAERADAARGVVRLTVGPYMMDRFVRPRLFDFCREHPQIELEFRPYHEDTPRNLDWVRRGELDLAVCASDDPWSLGLPMTVVRPAGFNLYGQRRFAGSADATPAALGALPFVLPLEGSGLDVYVQGVLRKAGIVCSNVVARTQFFDVMHDMVVSGVGVGLLFESTLRPLLATGEIVKLLQLPPLYRAIVRAEPSPGPLVGVVERFLLDALQAEVEETGRHAGAAAPASAF